MQPQASDPSTPVLEPLETEAPRTDVVPSTDDGDHDPAAAPRAPGMAAEEDP